MIFAPRLAMGIFGCIGFAGNVGRVKWGFPVKIDGRIFANLPNA
jgi:hypothetical protein